MNKTTFLVLITLGLGPFGCGHRQEGNSGDLQLTQQNLVGGLATEAYPSTVRLFGCTSSKISDRVYLTAAHCVTDPNTAQVRPEYAPAKGHYLYHQGKQLIVILDKVIVHPSYLQALVPFIGKNDHHARGVAKKSFDVALISIKENLTQIPAATVDFRPVVENEWLAVGGYGCTSWPNGPTSEKLKMGLTQVVGKGELGNDSRYWRRSVKLEIVHHNIITGGQNMDDAFPSICPGDSGGPVYRGNSQNLVVGVNSYYGFENSRTPADTNWHTRLSNLSAWFGESLKALK